jgi:hypothetical protein
MGCGMRARGRLASLYIGAGHMAAGAHQILRNKGKL